MRRKPIGLVGLVVLLLVVVAGLLVGMAPGARSGDQPQPSSVPWAPRPEPVPPPAPAPTRLPDRPNLVVVMADDMRVDDLAFAPALRRLVADQGVTFANAFAPFPLCCPNRASFLTGQYAHNHGVYWHEPPWGYGSFDDSRTIATSLQEAGYRTGFVGKYLNRYGVDRSKISGMPSHRFVPPGWTDWRAAVENPGNAGFHGQTYDYFDTPFNVNGRIDNRYRGVYQSKVLGDMSVAMARRFASNDDPFFMYVNYVAPHHGAPVEADDRTWVRDVHGRRVQLPTPARPRSVRGAYDDVIRRGSGIAAVGAKVEIERGDKPRPVQRRTKDLTKSDRAALREVTRQRAESILVMDRHIARLVRTLKRTGEWENTVFAFTSDNGMLVGEHGFQLTKVRAYEPSLRVPMLLTGPGLRDAQVRHDPMSTLDLTATLLDLAVAEPPRRPDGTSRRVSLEEGDQGWTTPVVTEAIETSNRLDPAFDDPRTTIGLRVSRYSYTRYANGQGELYDLLTDPRQDHNVHGRDAYAEVRAALEQVWRSTRDCEGDECRVPLPPVLAADPTTNAATTASYWQAITAAYGW